MTLTTSIPAPAAPTVDEALKRLEERTDYLGGEPVALGTIRRALELYRELATVHAWHIVEVGNAPASFEPTWECPAWNSSGPCDDNRCGLDQAKRRLTAIDPALATDL